MGKKKQDANLANGSFLDEESVRQTLQYLATGLVEWEKLSSLERSQVPKALRIGMSRMHAISILQKEQLSPKDLWEFFRWCEKPIKSWKPAAGMSDIPDEATLIDDGLVSDFARDWALSGKNPIAQVQEQLLKEVKEFCTPDKEEAYRSFRNLIITKPVVRTTELDDHIDTPELIKLSKFFKNERTYKPLTKLAEYDEYHLCPRCKYFQRLRDDGVYSCRNAFCQRLQAGSNPNRFKALNPIPRVKASEWLAVDYGVYLYGTLPGIWEVKLAEELEGLGAKVTMWPNVDWYDLLVELPKGVKWAIDVKDWSYLTPQRLEDVRSQPEATQTLVVFPDERDDYLRIPIIRNQKQYSPKALRGLQLKLISEVVKAAKKEIQQNA